MKSNAGGGVGQFEIYFPLPCGQTRQPDFSLSQMDRSSSQFDIGLNKARPWREIAREGVIFAARQVRDGRSENKTEF